MTTANQTDRSITLAANRLTTGRHATQIATRWTHDPYLHGWTPTATLDALSQRGHDDHDRIMRGLIDLSHRHDEDATTLLLAALRPGLWKLAHTYHRTRANEAFDDLVVSAVHVIARVDPAADRLYDRILGRVRAATPSAPTTAPHEIVIELDKLPTPDSDFIDHLEARDTLRRLSHILETDTIHHAKWNDLIAVRVHRIKARDIARGRTTNQVRADISRYSRHLQRLLAA